MGLEGSDRSMVEVTCPVVLGRQVLTDGDEVGMSRLEFCVIRTGMLE